MPLTFGTGYLTEVEIPLIALDATTALIAAETAVIAAAQVEMAVIETARYTEQVAVDTFALAQQGIQLVQMALYWDRFDDAVDLRDAKIDAQIAFMTTLDANRTTLDTGMLNAKAGVIAGLSIPGTDLCTDAIRYRACAEGDGDAVDEKAEHLAAESCGGIPTGWGTHEGSLMAAKSGSFAGGLLGSSAKRQREEMIDRKVPIVRAAHTSMRAVFRGGDVLAKYAQAAAIHSGLADIYLQGFNSAGAGLGVALAQSGGSAPTTSGEIGNSTTISTGSEFSNLA